MAGMGLLLKAVADGEENNCEEARPSTNDTTCRVVSRMLPSYFYTEQVK